MKSKTLRVVIPLAIVAIIGVGYVTNVGIGTIAAFGWQDIALLCPLGALTSMLAAKLLIPRALISLVLAIIVILIVGRAFCAWVCPVPIIGKLRYAFKKKDSSEQEKPHRSAHECDSEAAKQDASDACHACSKQAEASSSACKSCAEKRAALDSRHFVLGGALASAAIFGFPVFCLICPIGLTFATILLVIRLFSFGDVTWAVIAVPALLAVEVIFFRKWCSKICPLSALMSIIAKLNKTFKPTVDETKCLETSKGASCERCTNACPEGINIRHPELGASMSECTRCRACVDACPAHAISLPLISKTHQAAMAESANDAETKPEHKDGDLA